MHLFSLTLQQPTGINKAIIGSFSRENVQDIVVARGKHLELWRKDDNEKLLLDVSQEVFGLIRCIAPIRILDSSKDSIIVTSDSGLISILQYDTHKKEFYKVQQKQYGKTGCRKTVPGQYIATDPRGRAIMIGAIESQKSVFLLGKDSMNKVIISNPIESNKPNTIIFDICGVDCGPKDPPTFAVLEVEYSDVEKDELHNGVDSFKKYLVFYELDQTSGKLNKRNSYSVHNSASCLIPLPYSHDFIGAVNLCFEDSIMICDMNKTHGIECNIPKRKNDAEKRIINSYCIHKHNDYSFVLIQTENGDIFKVTNSYSREYGFTIYMIYLDTISPAISLCLFKTGYLFAASEFGNHGFYNIQNLGNDENDVRAGSGHYPAQFLPRPLRNLVLLEEIENMTAITDLKVADLTKDGTPQIYATLAANSRSLLKVLRHGLSAKELASSELPEKAYGIWTVKTSLHDELDRYIIISTSHNTFVLSVGETVSEIKDSGIDRVRATIHIGLLEGDSIVQVCSNGIRLIKDKKEKVIIAEKKILKATSNSRQVVIACEREILYYELDNSGQLVAMEKTEKIESEIVCLDIPKVPEGKKRAKFVAAGYKNFSVELFSLEPESCLKKLSSQALPNAPESVCLQEFGEVSDIEIEGPPSELFLHIGLKNGVMMKASVDLEKGTLFDIRKRNLGSAPIRLFKIQIRKKPAMLALSSKPWISYTYMGKKFFTPLNYDTLDYGASVANPSFEGIVAINTSDKNSSMRIITLDKLGESFNQKSLPLTYSPRKLLIHNATNNLVLIESDQRVYDDEKKATHKQEMKEESKDYVEAKESQVGAPKIDAGNWASCIRIVDAKRLETLSVAELRDNQNAVSMLITTFEGSEDEYLIVGTVEEMRMKPKSFKACYLYIFIFADEGKRVKFQQKIQVDDIPYSLAAFRGKLLAGIGTVVRMYEYGKKKLLKKAEIKYFQAGINSIQVSGDRIFVTDIADSFHALRYKPKENQFFEFAEDVLPRWATSTCLLDNNTLAGSDKFENFYVCRLPQNVEEDIEEDLSSFNFKWETGNFNGAAYKMEMMCHYYYGEVITCLQKGVLGHGESSECIVFGTTMGSIGVFLPFETREDVDFFTKLEVNMREADLSLVGRDHLMFRSFIAPTKNVVDGDLCEQYSKLEHEKQKALSQELETTPNEVFKKLEELRNRIF